MIASSNVSSTTEPSHNHYTCRQCKQDKWGMSFCDCILNGESECQCHPQKIAE